jgi:hypothetical protein
MKLTLRIAALSIVAFAAVAAISTPRTASALPSHQAAAASLPIDTCSDCGLPGN